MACSVQRPISQDCLSSVPSIKNVMSSLPKESRTCSECSEVVFIHETPTGSAGAGIAFEKAEFIGCDAVIDAVIDDILREGFSRGLNFTSCFEAVNRRQAISIQPAGE